MDSLFDITGKVAIITGGAGGLGRAVALAFAERGADVIVTSRDLKKLEAVANEIHGLGRKSLALACDVSDEKSVNSMVDRVLKEFPRIDILVNTAGANVRKTAIDTTADEYLNTMGVNALGTFLCCKAVAKIMMQQKGGKIINYSSIRGRFGIGGGKMGAAAYGSTKGAVESLTRALACEWGLYNINVNVLAPSIIKTEFTRSFFEADAERAKKLKADYPLGRIGELTDIIGPTVFLASDASNFITGQILYVDGGTSAGFMSK